MKKGSKNTEESKNKYCENKIGGNLHPHHIKPFALFPKLIFDINNGKTLCRGCHKIKTKDDWLKWKDFKREVLI